MEFLSITILSLLITSFVYYLFFSDSKTRKGLPPGPKPWPIVGNLLQLSDKPHSQFYEMAKIYGDLFTLKMGTQIVVVASSPAAATEILKTHDRLLSTRYVFQSFRIPNLIENSMVFSDCTDHWNRLKKICRTQIFTPKMIESQAHMRESKVTEMVKFIKGKQGSEIKLSEVVFETLVNTFGNLIFSQDIFQMGDPSGEGAAMKGLIWRMLELGNSTNPSDYFPILARFDLFGHKKDVADCLRQIYDVWGVLLKERKAKKSTIQGNGGNYNNNDFVDVLLDSGLEDHQINVMLFELFGAGTETTSSTIEWAMVELTKNPHIATKLRAELSSVVGQRPVKESDIPNLPYLQAITKETLRLHPSTPLSIPRRASETCQVMNHTIPKDCQILINVWAIGRDPKAWEDACKFSPERFLKSSIDYKGNYFELIPFGAGRRICPGMPLAVQAINLIVATLVHNFEWDLPNGMDPKDLLMDEKFGLTLQKEPPLYIIPKSRV